MFNGYGNYGNFQYPVYGQPQQQPQQQQMQQQQYNPQPSGNYFYVNGIEGAKGFMVQPNSAVVLFDSDSQEFYIKTANQQGQATLKEFEYTEINPQIAAVPAQKQTATQFVSAVDFESFKKDFEEFKTKVINYIKKTKEDK